MTTLMMNPQRLRSSLRRLFSNDWNEIIGELLQNAQRAGATEIAFTMTEAGFRVADNGHGLQGGIAGIATLLSLGDSAFENPAVADQEPMGLGIHALLAAEGVEAVCFSSGLYATTIDTARWWTDMDYVARWQEQVQELAQPVPGMQIDVTCSHKVATAFRMELTGDSYWLNDGIRAREGYADLLTITLDGVALATETPDWLMPQPICTTTYRDCALTIGTSSLSSSWGVVQANRVLDTVRRQRADADRPFPARFDLLSVAPDVALAVADLDARPGLRPGRAGCWTVGGCCTSSASARWRW